MYIVNTIFSLTGMVVNLAQPGVFTIWDEDVVTRPLVTFAAMARSLPVLGVCILAAIILHQQRAT